MRRLQWRNMARPTDSKLSRRRLSNPAERVALSMCECTTINKGRKHQDDDKTVRRLTIPQSQAGTKGFELLV